MVAQALDAVEAVYNLPIPVESSLETDERCYVYAYFTNPKAPTWENCFYIGKGIKNRWTVHVAKRCAPSAPPAGSNKERQIDAWLVEQRNEAGQLSPQAFRKGAVKQGLVRKLGGWTGPHREACAFAAEHFLIKGFRNVYALANETGGNTKTGALRVLARYQGLNMASESHLTAWKDTIKTFIADPDNPILDSRHQPLLQLLSNQSLSLNLDSLLSPLNLFPHAQNDRYFHNYHDVPGHFSVKYSGDLSITYATNDQRPFRIQIKLSKTEPSAVVNVRPRYDRKAEREKYFNYFSSLTIRDRTLTDYYGGESPISGGDQSPYFKPFARDGKGSGSNFELDPAYKVDGYANWIDGGDFRLGLKSALELFLATFPCP
jgi:hypothetical protein